MSKLQTKTVWDRMEKADNGNLVRYSDETETKEIKKVFHEYAESATMHGLRFAFSGTYSNSKRVLWALVLLAMMAGFSATFINSIVDYYNYETVTSSKIVRRTNMTLPSVTICNVNAAKESKLSNFSAEYTAFLHAASGIIGGLQVPRDPVPKISRTVLFKDFYERFGAKSKDIFVSCNVASTSVNCDDYVTSQPTDQGTCQTFNSREIISKRGDTEIKSAGPSYGLTFTLDVDPDDYGHPLRLGEGYIIKVHQPDTFPFMEEGSSFVSAGGEYFFAMKQVDTISLPKPYSEVDCITDDQKETVAHDHGMITAERNEAGYSKIYSYEGCKKHCLNKYISKRCKCDFGGSRPGDELCTMWDVTTCLSRAESEFVVSGDDCGCLPTCKKTSFESQISSLAFPNRLMSDYAVQMNWPVQNLTEINRRYLYLHIYFDSMEQIIHQQVAVIDITQLLSNFGGQMGLYMGASIVTMIEFLDFLINVISRCCKKKH